jgi:hypothetical protein
MTTTYEAIATTTLSSGQQIVDFTSIPNTYTDLVLVTNVIGTTGDYLRVRFGNGSIDSGSNYSTTVLAAGASGNVSAYRYANNTVAYIFVEGLTNSSNPTINVMNILNYGNSTTFKTFINRASSNGTVSETSVSLWRSTSAINTIRVFQDTYNMAAGSTFTLYGIKAE